MVAKRVAILTPVLPPYHGGIGKVALVEAEYLARVHEVTIFTPKYSYIDKDEEQRGRVKIKYNKPIFSFGNAAVLPNLKKELHGFDIVYLHYPFFGTAELLIYNLQPITYNLVIRYHMDVVGRGLLKPFFWLHTKLLMPQILQRADKIIVSTFDYAQNSNIKNLLKKYPNNFAEIYFRVDTKKFKPEPKSGSLLLKYGLQAGDKVLLFVGSLDCAHYFKGLEILLLAVAELRSKKQEVSVVRNNLLILNSRFLLLVVGDGNLRPYYETLTKKLGISELVRFIGSASNDELPTYYNLADVFVFPSIDRSEAFGLALLEAAACGKPVVASNLAGVRTLIKEGKNGFLAKPGDAYDLGEKILRVFENNESFGRESRQLVMDNYTQDKLANQLFDIF